MNTEANNYVTIQRDGFAPLRFRVAPEPSCWSASNRTDRFTAEPGGDLYSRWTDVQIYKTAGGKYVAVVAHRMETRRRGQESEGDLSTKIKAGWFSRPRDLIEWLEDDDGRLDSVSQAAIVKAAEDEDAFARAFVVAVD